MEYLIEDNKVLYAHYRKTDNQIFYVGYGTPDRPYLKCGRNSHWHNTVDKHEYYVKILEENLSEERAKELEIKTIAFYGRKDKGLGNLVNMTDGGDGIDSKYGMDNPFADRTIYTFKKGKTIEICTKYELVEKYSLPLKGLGHIINGTCRTYRGWRCLNPKKEFKSKKTFYLFLNRKTSTIEYCTQIYLRRKYNLNNISDLVLGKINYIEDWICLNPKSICTKRDKVDRTIYTFIHEDNISEICTQLEFRKKYNLHKGSVSDLVNGGRKSYKGWSVMK